MQNFLSLSLHRSVRHTYTHPMLSPCPLSHSALPHCLVIYYSNISNTATSSSCQQVTMRHSIWSLTSITNIKMPNLIKHFKPTVHFYQAFCTGSFRQISIQLLLIYLSFLYFTSIHSFILNKIVWYFHSEKYFDSNFKTHRFTVL